MLLEIDRVKPLRLIAFDVDGILTDNHVWMLQPGEWRRTFSIRDGYGIQMLIEKGYQIAFITGSRSDDVKERAKVLKIHYFYEGTLNKVPAYEEIKQKTGFKDEQILYMGDDFFDIPLIEKAGLGITVPDASQKVRDVANYITQKNGGFGAVREVCEIVLEYGSL
jgi:3-deoxy-D-manno-octulosonate 8-phosphate phosphatase (KDO 8-P phosphatase)